MLTDEDMRALRHGFNTDIDIPKLMREYEYAERSANNNMYKNTFVQDMYQLYDSLRIQHKITTWTNTHTMLLRDACIAAKVSFGTIVIYVMVGTSMYRVDNIATRQPFGKNYTVRQVWQQVCYQLQVRSLLSGDITAKKVKLHQCNRKNKSERVVRDWDESYMRDDLDVSELYVNLSVP